MPAGLRDSERNRREEAGQAENWNRSRSFPSLFGKNGYGTVFNPPAGRGCSAEASPEIGPNRIPSRDEGCHNALALGNGNAFAIEKQGFQPGEMGSQLADRGRFHCETLLRHTRSGVNQGYFVTAQEAPERIWAANFLGIAVSLSQAGSRSVAGRRTAEKTERW